MIAPLIEYCPGAETKSTLEPLAGKYVADVFM